jgi:hypothetical protein
MNDIRAPAANQALEYIQGFQQCRRSALTVDLHYFNIVGGKEIVKVASTTYDRGAMSESDLSTGEIDGGVNMSVHAARVV